MRPELSIPLAGLVAAAVTYLVTPLAIHVARRTGFMDKPAGYKGHGNPTPYLGGSAIMVGVLAAAFALGGVGSRYAVLLACVILMWAVGTADDRLNLSPHLRLVLEVAIGVTLSATGHGWNALGIAPLDWLLTVAWVVGIVNAVNLMDNMDGAAASVVGISATGTGALAIVAAGRPELGILCFAAAGGCAGFLPRNLSRPSRIFMGDGGSMPLGLLVAGTSMQVASAGNLGVAGVLEVALIVGLAILDTSLVMFSRRRGGRPLMTGGRDHLTHRLHSRLDTPRAVAGSLALAQLALCSLAIVAGLVGAGAILGMTALVLGIGALAITRLERHPWFDAPAARILVAETHAAQLRRRPTRFVRRGDHARSESVPA
jgi:UDP-GlcNAc:undecaprenyl-phosphate/decaprenyl-phosphate GlcNAc-1-phosphate transferase